MTYVEVRDKREEGLEGLREVHDHLQNTFRRALSGALILMRGEGDELVRLNVR